MGLFFSKTRKESTLFNDEVESLVHGSESSSEEKEKDVAFQRMHPIQRGRQSHFLVLNLLILCISLIISSWAFVSVQSERMTKNHLLRQTSFYCQYPRTAKKRQRTDSIISTHVRQN